MIMKDRDIRTLNVYDENGRVLLRMYTSSEGTDTFAPEHFLCPRSVLTPPWPQSIIIARIYYTIVIPARRVTNLVVE